MPNPIKDLIEKRKIPEHKITCPFLPSNGDVDCNCGLFEYNRALDDLTEDTTFLKSLEDGLVERVNKIKTDVSNDYISKERVRDIIKNFFNPEK